MQRFADFVTRRPVWVLLGVLALCVVAVLQIVDVRTGTIRLTLDPSSSALFPRNDPTRDFYEHVRKLFGSDETLVVALVDEKNGVFTQANLERVQRLTDQLAELPGVHHVTSLANALNIRGAGDGELEIEPFLTEIPTDAEGLARLREQALGNPIYAGNLVAKSGKATALYVYLDDMTDAEFLARDLDHQVIQLAEQASGEAEVWVTGGALVKAANTRMGLRDVAVTTPLIALVIAAISAVTYRSLRAVLLPLIAIGLGTLWTAALIAWSGRPINMVTIVVPALVLTLGFADSVHVVADYFEALRTRRAGEDKRALVRRSLREVVLPVVLCALTTAFGFMAIALSTLEATREFGLFCLAATAFCALASLTFVPAVLSLLPLPKKLPGGGGHGAGGHDRFGDWLRRIAAFDVRHRRWIYVGAALLGLFSLWGVTKIRVGLDQITNFRPDNPVRRHFEAINQHLEGSNLFYVVLEADYTDAFREPVNLAEIESLQQWLVAQPEIGGTTSLADYVKLINRGFHDDDPAELRIPESKRLVTQLLFFGSNDELERVVDSHYQTTTLLVRSKVMDTGEVVTLIRRIEERLAQLPGRMKGTVTGNSVLVTRTLDTLSQQQALSLASGFLLIYGMLAITFTSLWVGLMALIPNALPILVYFGTLGWTGIGLSPVTSVVGPIVLGIAVDDTIHFITRFSSVARRLADERKGAIEALAEVGRPAALATATLCIGMLMLCMSEARSQVQFGALAAFTLLVAWLIELTLMPALSSRLRIVSLWEVLTLDLGHDPQHSIPFFRGLGTNQARIVALMTSIRNFPTGHRLFEAGEAGDDMYVVLDGELRVLVPTASGPPKQVATLRRGDVVGEVALFKGERSADVEAASDVRLLRFTEKDLRRLRRRYPRIGGQVLTNLSEILAGRLMEANRRAAAAA
jgi:predicted RND superfamily exporter protein